MNNAVPRCLEEHGLLLKARAQPDSTDSGVRSGNCTPSSWTGSAFSKGNSRVLIHGRHTPHSDCFQEAFPIPAPHPANRVWTGCPGCVSSWPPFRRRTPRGLQAPVRLALSHTALRTEPVPLCSLLYPLRTQGLAPRRRPADGCGMKI